MLYWEYSQYNTWVNKVYLHKLSDIPVLFIFFSIYTFFLIFSHICNVKIEEIECIFIVAVAVVAIFIFILYLNLLNTMCMRTKKMSDCNVNYKFETRKAKNNIHKKC